MRQAVIFTLLSCTLITAAPAVARESRDRAQAARKPPYDWVLVDGDGDNPSRGVGGGMMSGSRQDLDRARALRREYGDPLLYVERGGRAWIFRDGGLVSRVHAAMAPTEELGKRMSALGEKMSAIGDEQRVIGDKMGLIGNKMGKIGGELARIAPEDPRRAGLQDEMSRLQTEMEPLQDEMSVLSTRMQPLSDEMSRHGKEMKRLSERAQAEITEIIEDGFAQGLARELK
jgi:hypothetical protein